MADHLEVPGAMALDENERRYELGCSPVSDVTRQKLTERFRTFGAPAALVKFESIFKRLRRIPCCFSTGNENDPTGINDLLRCRDIRAFNMGRKEVCEYFKAADPGDVLGFYADVVNYIGGMADKGLCRRMLEKIHDDCVAKKKASEGVTSGTAEVNDEIPFNETLHGEGDEPQFDTESGPASWPPFMRRRKTMLPKGPMKACINAIIDLHTVKNYGSDLVELCEKYLKSKETPFSTLQLTHMKTRREALHIFIFKLTNAFLMQYNFKELLGSATDDQFLELELALSDHFSMVNFVAETMDNEKGSDDTREHMSEEYYISAKYTIHRCFSNWMKNPSDLSEASGQPTRYCCSCSNDMGPLTYPTREGCCFHNHCSECEPKVCNVLDECEIRCKGLTLTTAYMKNWFDAPPRF